MKPSKYFIMFSRENIAIISAHINDSISSLCFAKNNIFSKQLRTIKLHTKYRCNKENKIYFILAIYLNGKACLNKKIKIDAFKKCLGNVNVNILVCRKQNSSTILLCLDEN